jgi:hypothetical protein
VLRCLVSALRDYDVTSCGWVIEAHYSRGGGTPQTAGAFLALLAVLGVLKHMYSRGVGTSQQQGAAACCVIIVRGTRVRATRSTPCCLQHASPPPTLLLCVNVAHTRRALKTTLLGLGAMHLMAVSWPVFSTDAIASRHHHIFSTKHV